MNYLNKKFIAIFFALLCFVFFTKIGNGEEKMKNYIKLPAPKFKGTLSVEEAIAKRRSIRSYKKRALTIPEVSQLLWAACGQTPHGITGASRAYPSAGATYPLETYLLAGDVEGLKPGLYHYLWKEHALKLIKEGDLRNMLAMAAWGQGMVSSAPASLIFTAIYERSSGRYGQRGKIRYVHMDMGHAGENVYLQAEALGLGTVAVGAFMDAAVKKVLGVGDNEEPIYIMPVGEPR